MARKKKNKLKKDIWRIPQIYYHRDKIGRYISHCDFGRHKGLIASDKLCKSRSCNYFTKHYIYIKK